MKAKVIERMKDKIIEILKARRVRPPYEFIALGGNDEGYLLEIATRIDSLYQAKSKEEAETTDEEIKGLFSDWYFAEDNPKTLPHECFIAGFRAAFGKEGEDEKVLL